MYSVYSEDIATLQSKIQNANGVIREASRDFVALLIPTDFKDAAASAICFHQAPVLD